MGKLAAARFAWAAAPSWLLPLLLLLATAVAEPPSNADELPGCKRGKYLDSVTGKCHSCTHGVDFMDEDHNRQLHCQPCSPCSSMKEVAEPCTTAKDTVCRCPRGYRENVEGMCSPSDSHGLTATAPSAGATAALSAITTPSAAGAAGMTENPGRHRSDVLSDLGRPAEDQPELQLTCNGDMGWAPFVQALMVILLVIVLFFVVMIWRNQRAMIGGRGHHGSQVKEDGQPQTPAITGGQQASHGSGMRMSAALHPEKGSPPPALTVKSFTHPRAEHHRHIGTPSETVELQAIITHDEHTSDSALSPAVTLPTETAGRITAEHNRHFDPVFETDESQTFLLQNEDAPGQDQQDQVRGRNLFKRSISQRGSSSAASASI